MFAPRPAAPSLISGAVRGQIPRVLPPFPPFLPPVGAARRLARNSPRRAPTRARPPASPGSPPSGSRHHCPWDAPVLRRPSPIPLSRRTRGVRDAERVLTVPSRFRLRPGLRHLPKPPLVPGPTHPSAGRASEPPAQPSPSPAGPEGSPGAKGLARGAHTDRRTVPARHLRVGTLPPNSRPGPSRSRTPAPPRLLLRTFRASLGRPRGSAPCPRPGLGCATAPERPPRSPFRSPPPGEARTPAL